MPAPPPHCLDLTLLIQPPHRLHLLAHLLPEYPHRGRPHVVVPRRKDNLVRLKDTPVGKLNAVWQDLLDFLPLFDGDLAVDDELGGANVDVVAAAALPVLEDEAGAEGAVVELEADALETFEQLVIEAVDAFCGVDVEALEHGGGGAVHV